MQFKEQQQVRTSHWAKLGWTNPLSPIPEPVQLEAVFAPFPPQGSSRTESPARCVLTFATFQVGLNVDPFHLGRLRQQ